MRAFRIVTQAWWAAIHRRVLLLAGLLLTACATTWSRPATTVVEFERDNNFVLTGREYLKKEATDVLNVLIVALVALTISAVLWFSPALIDHVSHWYRTYIACVEDANTLGDVIRSRNLCIRVTTLKESR